MGCVSATVMREIHRDVAARCSYSCIERSLWARGEDSSAHLRQTRAALAAECTPLCFGHEARVHAKPIVPVQLLPLFLVRMTRRLLCAADQQEFAALCTQLKQRISSAADASGHIGAGGIGMNDALALCYVVDFVRDSTWMHGALAPLPMLAPPPVFVPGELEEEYDVPAQAQITHRYAQLRKRNVLAVIGDVIERDLSAVSVTYRHAFPGALSLAARAEIRLGCDFEMVKDGDGDGDDADDDDDKPRVKRSRKKKDTAVVEQ